MKNTLILFLLFLAFGGCKDDDVVPEPSQWQEMSHFTGRDKILINSMATEKALYLYGVGRITVVTDPGDNGEFSYKNWAGFGHTDILHKPLMHRDFILDGTYENAIRLTTPSGFTQKSFRFDLEEFDSSITRLDINKYWFGEYIKTNNNKQLLIRVDHPTRGPWTYVLATLSVPASFYIESVDMKYVETSIDYGTQFACSIDEYFFIGDSRMYRVDTSGNSVLASTDIMLRHPFKYSFDNGASEVYMGVSQNDYVVISYDRGLTWENFSSQSISDLNRFQFKNIDGKILGYHSRYGIIHLDITENTIEIKHIDTEGIGNEITSLSKFKDQYIVTTFSGAFKKSASEFFTYRD